MFNAPSCLSFLSFYRDSYCASFCDAYPFCDGAYDPRSWRTYWTWSESASVSLGSDLCVYHDLCLANESVSGTVGHDASAVSLSSVNASDGVGSATVVLMGSTSVNATDHDAPHPVYPSCVYLLYHAGLWIVHGGHLSGVPPLCSCSYSSHGVILKCCLCLTSLLQCL